MCARALSFDSGSEDEVAAAAATLTAIATAAQAAMLTPTTTGGARRRSLRGGVFWREARLRRREILRGEANALSR